MGTTLTGSVSPMEGSTASGDSSDSDIQTGTKTDTMSKLSKQRRERTPRVWERRANSRRAAWNRIGATYKLTKEDIDYAKKCELSPYPILRKNAVYTADSVRAYIWNGGITPRDYASLADYLVDREIDRLAEIARLEQEGVDDDEILERVSEHWW